MSNTSIDYPEARIIRSEALKWWATSLAEEDRKIYAKAYFGPDCNHHALRGKEIEQIYVNAKD